MLFVFFNRRTNNQQNGAKCDWKEYEESIDGEDLELFVKQKLSKLERADGKVIHDCYLRWPNGTTTQIDDILIFRSGIYVIECKDYSGWIFGNSAYEYWTQTLPYGYRGDSTKNSFYNPVKQNQNHIKCIRQKLLNVKSIPIHNIIVFGDNCTFKDLEITPSEHVIKVGKLYETIYRIEQEIGNRLSVEDINNIFVRLTQDVTDYPSIRSDHIRNVQRIKAEKYHEQHFNSTACPRCGFPLVLRNGQYGQFYGCSRYPSCKYTRQVKHE